MTELKVNLDGKEIAERVSEIQRDENGLLCRSFNAEMSAGDGRTIDVRIVPYGVPAEVSDDGRTSYREMWMPGAFADQARGAQAGRASHVMVNFRHGGTFGDVIGHGVSLVERDDAFYGSFKILDGPDGDKALELVRAEALSKVSLEAFAKKTARTAEGIVQRIKGHLVNIALTPQGAYDAAAVLAIREEQLAAEKAEEQVASFDMAPELVERLRRAGISLPARYDQAPEVDEAHPAGHPADGGTPDEQHPPGDTNHEAKGE